MNIVEEIKMLEIREIGSEKFDGFYERAMGELGEFFGKNWVRNRPKLFFVKNRETFDMIVERKTEDWEIAVAYGKGIVFLLSPEAYEKDSCHKYSDYRISKTIKHELVHCFWDVFTSRHRPIWLSEGLAVYLAGQRDDKYKVDKFSRFLDFYNEFDRDGYFESGLAVGLLVEKFGKGKVLELLRKLDSVKSEEGFHDLFERVYGFGICYEKMNELLGECK